VVSLRIFFNAEAQRHREDKKNEGKKVFSASLRLGVEKFGFEFAETFARGSKVQINGFRLCALSKP